MSQVNSLSAWGTLRPAEVVELAASAGLPLAAAAALLEQESGGGRNVWGSDRVATGGAYVKGAEVTESAYRAYRRALSAGTAGQQGVGPCQLTAVGYQDQADALGGCWMPRANVTVGLRLLAGYVARWDLARAFRAYNGGAGTVTDPRRYPSPAAHTYERAAMTKYTRWRDRLGSTAAAPVRPSPTPRTEPFMAALSDTEQAELLAGVRALLKAKPGVRLPGRSAAQAQIVDDEFGWTMTGAGRADDAARGVAALAQRLDAYTQPDVDYDRLAAVLLPQLVAALTARP